MGWRHASDCHCEERQRRGNLLKSAPIKGVAAPAHGLDPRVAVAPRNDTDRICRRLAGHNENCRPTGFPIDKTTPRREHSEMRQHTPHPDCRATRARFPALQTEAA